MRITVENGNTSKDHYIHRALLQKKSPYFAALPNFKEGKDNHLVLKDINGEAFQHIVQWLYTGQFSHNLTNHGNHGTPIILTYAAADRLMMLKCKNMAIDKLRVRFRTHYAEIRNLVAVNQLGYPPSANIVTCIMDQFVYDNIERQKTDISGEKKEDFFKLDREYGFELACKLTSAARTMKKHKLVDPATCTGCKYHEHAEGEVYHLLRKFDV